MTNSARKKPVEIDANRGMGWIGLIVLLAVFLLLWKAYVAMFAAVLFYAAALALLGAPVYAAILIGKSTIEQGLKFAAIGAIAVISILGLPKAFGLLQNLADWLSSLTRL
jgi:hypothetical protein